MPRRRTPGAIRSDARLTTSRRRSRGARSLEGAAVAGAASIAAPFVNRGRYRLFAWSAAEYSARAIALIQRSIVIDMLCPLTLNFPQGDKWFASPETFTDKDFQKWRDSGHQPSCIPRWASAARMRTSRA